MVKYTELEDILKHAEVGDAIHLKDTSVVGSNCGEIMIVDVEGNEDEISRSGYNLWFEMDKVYGCTNSDETIEDLIYGYYEAWDGQIELIKGNEYVHIYSTLVDVMKREAKSGYFIEVRDGRVGEIVHQEYGYNVRFGKDYYGDDYPYADLKQLIQDYYNTWHGKIRLLVPRKKKEEEKFHQEYNNSFLKTTEDYVAKQIYEQFLVDDPVGFHQVRKQILKNKEVTYFKGEWENVSQVQEGLYSL